MTTDDMKDLTRRQKKMDRDAEDEKQARSLRSLPFGQVDTRICEFCEKVATGIRYKGKFPRCDDHKFTIS